MNTVEKGDKFEDRVYKTLKYLLENDELPLNKKRTKIFQKKKYYSSMQKSDIIFDISIESYMPNATEYSSLWLIECKDYKFPIDISKIRNFKKQIEEVGGHKGVFVTTSKFQRGAVSSAISYGMGLAVMQENDNLSWKVRRISPNGKSYYHFSNAENIFTQNDKSEDSFIGLSNNQIFNNLIDYLSFEGFPVIQPIIVSPYLSNETIEKKAIECIGKNNILENYYVHSKEIIDILKNTYGIDVISNTSFEGKELGRLDLVKNTIFLAGELEIDSPRWRFTLAHEFGHVVLHKSLLVEKNVYITSDDDNYSDPFYSITRRSVDKNIKRIEIQANIFASYLLMPNLQMAIKLMRLKKEMGLNKAYIHYDDQPVNIQGCNTLFSKISEHFGISKESIKYRLLQLGLLKDFSRSKKIASVFRDF